MYSVHCSLSLSLSLFFSLDVSETFIRLHCYRIRNLTALISPRDHRVIGSFSKLFSPERLLRQQYVEINAFKLQHRLWDRWPLYKVRRIHFSHQKIERYKWEERCIIIFQYTPFRALYITRNYLRQEVPQIFTLYL